MQITLRKFNESDICNKVRWINDPDTNRYLHYDLPLEYERTMQWFSTVKMRFDRYDAVIEVDGTSVGLIGLLDINLRNRKAEMYIALGERTYRGKGVAATSVRLLIDKAFHEFGLNRLYLYTERENIPAQRLFEKCGFRREGLLLEDLIYNGRKVDRWLYAITALEYEHYCDSDSAD